LTAEGIYQSVKEVIGKAPAVKSYLTGSALVGHPHGDEQGS